MTIRPDNSDIVIALFKNIGIASVKYHSRYYKVSYIGIAKYHSRVANNQPAASGV